MKKLVLYIGSGCPFCARVTQFLSKYHAQGKVEIIDVWQNEAAHQTMIAMTGGKKTVPCLAYNDTYMHESLDIIEKLKELLKL